MILFSTLTVLATILTAFIAMSFLSKRNNFNVTGRTVIVTGASQGLGLEIAKQLSAKGANVVIVAQTIPKLERALEKVRAAAVNPASQKFLLLSYDLRASDSGTAIISEVIEWNNGEAPDVVFNCAGHCIPGFFASSSIETLRDQMETVYWTCSYMAHSTLQKWIEPVSKEVQRKHNGKPRHLVFVASVVAFFPLVGYAPYTPGKAAMRSLADTLNQEVQVYNGSRQHNSPGPAADIKVHIVFPTGIDSEGFANEEKLKPALTRKLEESDKPQPPDELAKNIINELEAGKFSISGSFLGHLMKGLGMGSSQRVGIMDYLYGWLGSLVVLFVAPDFMSKCRKWGQEKGFKAAV